MKIGLFSDPHYCLADNVGLGRRPILSYEKIRIAMESFKSQGVDACFCLGDLIDRAKDDTKKEALENFNRVLSLIRSFKIPFYLVPGNHDYVDLSREDLKAAEVIAPLESPCIKVQGDECDFVLIDANFRSSGAHFDEEGHVWDDSNIPNEALEFLSDMLDSHCEKKCVVFLHENLDPCVQEQHIVRNALAVRKIIKKSGKVGLVIQGHYHEGSDWYDGNIHYHTVKAMCQGEENLYEIITV